MKAKMFFMQGMLVFTITLFFMPSCQKGTENGSLTCQITTPQSGDAFYQGDLIAITVTANDEKREIIGVKFIINGRVKDTVTVEPYIYTWNTDNEAIGTHFIICTAINDLGQEVSDKVQITILESAPPPVAEFTASVLSGTIPLMIHFTDQSSNNPTSWYWDFGDGNFDNKQNVVQTYTEPGVYSVTLIVANQYGTDTLTKTDYITVNQGNLMGTFVDNRDGQVYRYVTIGTQTWMADNLNIGKVIFSHQFPADNGIIEKYCFDDDTAYCRKYGGLYTWDEMMQYDTTAGRRGICPPGWHLPTDDEWKILEAYIGMPQSQVDSFGLRGTIEGGILKETGLAHWVEPNTAATNAVGFSALPGGYLYEDFTYPNILTTWYSSTQSRYTGAWQRTIDFDNTQIYRTDPDKGYAFSVRCVKN